MFGLGAVQRSKNVVLSGKLPGGEGRGLNCVSRNFSKEKIYKNKKIKNVKRKQNLHKKNMLNEQVDSVYFVIRTGVKFEIRRDCLPQILSYHFFSPFYVLVLKILVF